MMDKRGTVLAISVFVFLLASFSPAESEERTRISILGGLGDFSEKILKIRTQPFECKEGIIIIDIRNSEKSCKNLIECAKALSIRLSVIKENMEKSNCCYDIESKGPYRRKNISIDNNGNLLIERINDCRYVYDPDNPLVIKDGNFAGYVAYPNIDVRREYKEYIESVAELRTISQVLKLIEPSLVIKESEIPPFDTFNLIRDAEKR